MPPVAVALDASVLRRRSAGHNRDANSDTASLENPVNIIDVEGIGPVYAGQLEAVGVKSTDELLARGATPKGREELETATKIGHALILKWVNRVDLYRIKGVGSEYSDLLEIAGVDTVPELAQRNAVNLTETLAEANAARNLVRKLPTVEQVTDWVDQAKSMPRVVTY